MKHNPFDTIIRFLKWPGPDDLGGLREEIIKSKNVKLIFAEKTIGIYGLGVELVMTREEVGLFEAKIQ